MATAYTSLLGLALPVTGELSGTWGTTVNDAITSLLDSAVAGTTTLSSDADVTLTTTTGSSNQAREAIILWTAGGTATRTITAPAQSKTYIVINKTSSTQSIKLVGVGPTTGVTVVAGTSALVAWNGLDFVTVAVFASTGIVPVANGGTGLASGTSGGVLYYSASGTLASSAALAASAIVLGGGAGTAPATTTTGTGVVTAIGNSVNNTNGLITQTATLTASAILLGGGASTGISSTTTGTGVVTALGVNTGSSGAFVVNGGALGTPSGGTVTNLTGTASININGTVGATTAAAGSFTTLSASAYIRSTSTTITGAAGGTITPTSDATNQYTITALGAAATFAVPSGTPIDGQKLTIRIKDNGTARALTWTTSAGGYRIIGTTLPTTTVISKTVYVGCVYNSADSFWDVVAVAQQA